MLESINLEWLRSFVAFAELDGVEDAAIHLGLTQPAISQHLAKLEYAYGASLFQRVGKRKALTKKGRELYEKVSQHLRTLEDTLRSSKNSGATENDVTIRIAMNRDIYFRICDRLDFEGSIEIINMRSSSASAALLKRNVDIAVSRIVPDSPEIISTKWYSDTYCIAYPKSWKKNFDKNSQSQSLAGKKMILNSESKTQIKDVLMGLNFDNSNLKIKVSASDWHAILKLVEAEQGWAIVPTSFCNDPNVEFLKINSKLVQTTDFYILYHRSIRGFEGVNKLIDSIKKSFSETV